MITTIIDYINLLVEAEKTIAKIENGHRFAQNIILGKSSNQGLRIHLLKGIEYLAEYYNEKIIEKEFPTAEGDYIEKHIFVKFEALDGLVGIHEYVRKGNKREIK